jgi:hypothetical protein
MPVLKWVKRAILRAIRAAGYMLVPLPFANPPRPVRALAAASPAGIPPRASGDRHLVPDKPQPTKDHFADIEALLKLIAPWSGVVPEGHVVDFIGILMPGKFIWNRTGPFAEHYESTSLPTLQTHDEGWFEIADWLASTHDASGRYVAISIGAALGYQLVGAWKVLQVINPMPSLLVAVEPVPENCNRMRSLMALNGIDPDDHWIIQAAVGTDHDPILFPIGAPGSGLTDCIGTNSAESRLAYFEMLRSRGHCERALENILLNNSTGMTHNLGRGYSGEVKFVSAVTLRDVLLPFDRVDLLEADIQTESIVFSPFIGLLSQKVRRVHLGTHYHESHAELRALLSDAGWEIIFDYLPNSHYDTARGPLDLNDGIISARNPRLLKLA